jgi:hypothetical protein
MREGRGTTPASEALFRLRVTHAGGRLEDLLDVILELGPFFRSHLLHSQHDGCQREAPEELQHLPPLVVVEREAVDSFQKIAAHAGILGSRSSTGIYRKLDPRSTKG